jgi:hypothetical protein
MKGFAKKFRDNPQSGVMVGEKLAHWWELLHEWCFIHERYCKYVHDDAIFWHIELSNVGALASAAWRIDWVAVQESGCERRVEPDLFNDEPDPKQGHYDLYLQSFQSEDWVEAKPVFWDGRKKSIRIENVIDKACNDAMNISIESASERTKRVGVIFVIPSFPEGSDASWKPLERRLLPYLCKKIESNNLDAIAWCFPHIRTPLLLKGFRRYGVLLLAKCVV